MTPLDAGSRMRRHGLDFSFAAINIVLLLLFFFVVTGTIVSGGETALDPPVTSDIPPGRLPRPLLMVETNGALVLDGQVIAPNAVAERLTALRGRSRLVNIVSRRGEPAAPMLRAIRLAAAAGLEVRIVTQPPRRPR